MVREAGRINFWDGYLLNPKIFHMIPYVFICFCLQLWCFPGCLTQLELAPLSLGHMDSNCWVQHDECLNQAADNETKQKAQGTQYVFFSCQIAITCLQVIFYGWMRDRSVKMIDITYYIFRINWEIGSCDFLPFLPFFLSWPFQCKKTQGTESHCGDLIPSITFGRESREGWLGAWRVSFLRRVSWDPNFEGWLEGLVWAEESCPVFFFFEKFAKFWIFSSFFFGKTFFFQFQPWRMTLRQV